MRIGIDFDNTIICYDEVFCHLAKKQNLVPADYQGSKAELRAIVQASAEGDIAWQRLQGKAYGEYLSFAKLFSGVADFLAVCSEKNAEVFIVSHKTELGHFDEKRINLRAAAREWLRAKGFFSGEKPIIPEANVYFETTRKEKIARINSLGCTHFIDDLAEVLEDPAFPKQVQKFLFQPDGRDGNSYIHWGEIKNALFTD